MNDQISPSSIDNQQLPRENGWNDTNIAIT